MCKEWILVAATFWALLPVIESEATPGDLTPKEGLARCISPSGSTGLCSAVGLHTGNRRVTVSPNGLQVYVVHANEGIETFDRDPSTGALTLKSGQDGCLTALILSDECRFSNLLSAIEGIEISPDGKNAYGWASYGSKLSIFDRNLTTGVLSFNSQCFSADANDTGCTDPSTMFGAIGKIQISSNGASLYVLDPVGRIVVFDRASDGTIARKAGQLGCVSPDGGGGCAQIEMGYGLTDMALSPDGKSLYLAEDSDIEGLVILNRAADGTLTRRSGTSGCITSVIVANPSCTQGTAIIRPTSVVVSPTNESVYLGTHLGRSVAVFDRNTGTGALTQKSGTAACISVDGTDGFNLETTCVDGRGIDSVKQLLVSDDGASIYGESDYGGPLFILRRDVSTGTLSQADSTAACLAENSSFWPDCAEYSLIDDLEPMAISPDGRNLYFGSNSWLNIFDREPVPTPTPTPTPEATATPVPPSTPRLVSKPIKKTRSNVATFAFSSATRGVTYQCAIDSRGFASCRSPKVYRRLAYGRHSFAVRAIKGGVPSASVSYRWSIIR